MSVQSVEGGNLPNAMVSYSPPRFRNFTSFIARKVEFRVVCGKNASNLEIGPKWERRPESKMLSLVDESCRSSECSSWHVNVQRSIQARFRSSQPQNQIKQNQTNRLNVHGR